VVYRRRWLAIATVALATGLSGGAALAATGSSNPASDFLGGVAKRLGVSKDKLATAIRDETIARIDAAVAAGDITKAEGDALKQRVRSGDVPPVLPGLGGPGFGLATPPLDKRIAPGIVPGGDLMQTAADDLGMSAADLREAVRDGKSLADLATAKGKSVDGLKQALRDAIREDADQAVKAGAMTREQADRLIEKLGDAVDKLVEADPSDGFQLGGAGDGFGFRFRVAPGERVPRPSDAGGLSIQSPILRLKTI
jgi:hypothetical protein